MNIEQDAKRSCITSATVAAILGSNPNMTREDAMRRMVRDFHGAPSEVSANMALDHAINSADGALVEYGFETGHATDRETLAFAEDWCAADVTARAIVAGQVVGAVLVVCPFNLRDAQKPAPFRSVEDLGRYYDRAQLYLWASGASWVDLFQWCPTDSRIDRILPNADWQAENLPKLRAFHAEFQEQRQQDNCAEYLEPKRRVIDTPEAARIVAEYDQLSEVIDNATARRSELLADMVRLAGNRNALFAGRKLTLTKRAGAVSYARALKALAPDADLEAYRGKPSESWGVK